MLKLESRAVGPGELIRELDDILKARQENKYAFQVGLKDLDFEIDEGRARALELTIPFQSIDQAEQALREQVIKPTTFLEDDDTEHQVVAFEPEPVGYSGFMNCVTHSLALTDQGLFEVGRFSAMKMANQSRYWQWFLHRRLTTPEQVAAWTAKHNLTSLRVIEHFYKAMTGGSR